MIIFSGSVVTIISVIFIVLIIVCILGIGMGAAVLAPVLKILCYLISYFVVIASIGVCIKNVKTSAGKKRDMTDNINMIAAPVFNIVLFSMAVAIFLVPIYGEFVNPFETLGDAFLTGIGLILYIPISLIIVGLALLPYLNVIDPTSDKSQKWLLVSGIVSTLLLVLAWYCIVYYGNYRNGLPTEYVQEFSEAFRILPPGISQLIRTILMQGGEAVRQLIF